MPDCIEERVTNMARAKTKEEFLLGANEQFEKMWKLVEVMTKEEQHAAFHFSDDFLAKQKEAHWERDKNLRDVFIHLYEWHQLLLNWITSNQEGEKKPFLPEAYNWKTYGQMNVGFWEKHQNTPYDESIKMLKESHNEVMALTDTFSNDELFEKKHFSWTGSTTLGSYCISATSSHYDWAMKKIKAHSKFYKEVNK